MGCCAGLEEKEVEQGKKKDLFSISITCHYGIPQWDFVMLWPKLNLFWKADRTWTNHVNVFFSALATIKSLICGNVRVIRDLCSMQYYFCCTLYFLKCYINKNATN